MKTALQNASDDQLFRSLFEFSNDIILLSDTKGIITYVSPSIKKMGYEEAELIGKSAFDYIHPDYTNEILENCALLQQPGSTLTNQLLFLHKEGKWRWIESNTSNRTNIPDINAFVTNFRDITEQKEANDQLPFTTTLIQNIADAVIGTNMDFKIISWNRGAEEIYGWKNEEAIGKSVTEILTTKYLHEEDEKELRTHLHEKGFWQGEVMQNRKDGSGIAILASVGYVKDKNGKRIGTVGVNRDISQRKKEEQILKETKDQLELTFNNFPSAIYLFNNNGKILFANDYGAKLYGYASARELLDEKDLGVIHKKAAEIYDVQTENGDPTSLDQSATTQTLKSGRPSQLIFKAINKVTGEETWQKSSASPVYDADGNITMILSTNTDVTLQKTVEKDIRDSEERFRTLAEALPQLVWTTDDKGVPQYISRRWKEYTGLEPLKEDIWEQLVHPDDLKIVAKVWARSLETGESYITEFRIRTKEGIYRWNYVRGEPVTNDVGKVTRWVGAIIDIHEQKQAEHAIRRSEENFRQLADLVPQIIWTSRPNGHIDYYNNRWYDYTGFKEGTGDQSWIPVLHPDDVQDCIDTWYHSVKTGEPYHIQYRFIDRQTGSYRWFLGKALPIRNEEGAITKWFGTCTDINDQIMMTENLEQLVAQRTEELQRSNEELQQFAHVTSHDMKEPLRKIQTFGNLLVNRYGKELPAEATMYVDKMSASAKRLSYMIDEVLKYSLMSSAEEPFIKIDLNTVVHDVLIDLEITMQQKNAVVNYQNLPSIEGSKVYINQLFYNLLNNSLKFSSDQRNPVIDIHADIFQQGDVKHYKGLIKGNEYAEITITDNGIGFDQTFAERIFKTFTRLHALNKYEGTGLGLALCKKIVTRHKGLIFAQGKENEGSVFKIILPLNPLFF